jgi:TetR/AcrR family transcriptional regulator, regulator of cefoperazone and chloramphenicol sensitivity
MSLYERTERVLPARHEDSPSRRILEAAGEVFARQGFRRATVRDICKGAGVNVAAVNYYFGDKAGLYLATLKHFRTLAFDKCPLDLTDLTTKSELKPERALKTFIRAFVFRVLEEGKASWFGRLVAREYIEPSAALATLVEETIRPTYLSLAAIVERFFKGYPGEEAIRLCCMSVISQSLFFLYARPVLERLFDMNRFEPQEIERIASHIWRFSVKGIREIAKGSKEVCA